MKSCRACGSEKPEAAFYRRKSGQLKHQCKKCENRRVLVWSKANPEKARERQRRFRQRNPGRGRAWEIRKLYGMTSADLDALLAAQGGVCAICRTDRWSRGVPNVDHCHETNSVRGILCTRCNLGIGYFMDDPARLTAAAKYLGDHFAKTVAETIRRIA